jgi:hypothetical protein
MRIRFRSVNANLPEDFEKDAYRKFERALHRTTDSVLDVLITVTDVNGPKGGVDKLCRVSVVLTRSRHLTLEERDANAHVALARLAERTSRSVIRATKSTHARESIRLAAYPENA